MKTKVFPIAVLCADLHLTLLQPSCRADRDWMETQARYLRQLRDLQEVNHLSASKPLPVLCAGDILDKWNAPPELIAFALRELPDNMICVPGQHDLPNHRMEEMHRSGYGVLKEAGKIQDLSDGTPMVHGKLDIYGYGWGQEILQPGKERFKKMNFVSRKGQISVALIHRYVWTIDHSYQGAPESSHLLAVKEQLHGYDVAVFGDNHKGFLAGLKNGKHQTRVLNCGGFIRRKSDEKDYEPAVGILYSDGTVSRKKLDTSKDIFHAEEDPLPEQAFDMRAFLNSLEKLGEHGLNFKEAVLQHLETEEDIPPRVKELILKALDTHA